MFTEKSFIEGIPRALAATGFVVEHEVAEAFRAAKWGVIGSRYYIDDVDGRARELDLIAYKVTLGSEIDVVTSVLVSCKKDIDNAWVVMSRGRPELDPNLDSNPVHPWTNNELLDSYLGSFGWSEKYVRGDKFLFAELFEMKRQAFAFQLISKESCKPKNDKPIFESLTDLMKAQDHELSILPDRMKKKRLYTFNLLAVVDAPIYESKYDKTPPEVVKVDEFRHLARYIVNRRERVARINICGKEKLSEMVNIFDKLAKYDGTFFNKKIKEAYSSLKESSAVRKVIGKDLTKKLKWEIFSALSRQKRKATTTDVSVEYDEKEKILVLSLALDVMDVASIQSDAKLLQSTAKLLKSIARYSGKFRFDADVPF